MRNSLGVLNRDLEKWALLAFYVILVATMAVLGWRITKKTL